MTPIKPSLPISTQDGEKCRRQTETGSFPVLPGERESGGVFVGLVNQGRRLNRMPGVKRATRVVARSSAGLASSALDRRRRSHAPARFWTLDCGRVRGAGQVCRPPGATTHSPQGAQHDCCKPPDFNCCTIPEIAVPKELNKAEACRTSSKRQTCCTSKLLRHDPPAALPTANRSTYSALGEENDFEGATHRGCTTSASTGPSTPGSRYGGTVRVADMTPEEAQKAIETRRSASWPGRKAVVTASLAQTFAAAQQITGQHAVRPDGTVHLGTYGSVYVAGLNLLEVQQTIEVHLSKFLYKPEVCSGPAFVQQQVLLRHQSDVMRAANR